MAGPLDDLGCLAGERGARLHLARPAVETGARSGGPSNEKSSPSIRDPACRRKGTLGSSWPPAAGRPGRQARTPLYQGFEEKRAACSKGMKRGPPSGGLSRKDDVRTFLRQRLGDICARAALRQVALGMARSPPRWRATVFTVGGGPVGAATGRRRGGWAWATSVARHLADVKRSWVARRSASARARLFSRQAHDGGIAHHVAGRPCKAASSTLFGQLSVSRPEADGGLRPHDRVDRAESRETTAAPDPTW